ncbi:hypothetical protein DPEC_G00345070 [Dallia pectoralis]|uniref:Uncharacterized protein n=1 Tax=Dallia pectoralis TaxID=75939 RepID=A0ACC2F3G6_DALPE|nr:hypothetical protein DPEC_G00345070 [Dallia pectoralis]
MVEQLAFTQENKERIQAVENSFGPCGKPLLSPNRLLIGEGRLLKQCRHRPKPKVFYLFNDILVYGSIVLGGRWHKNQQVIPLEDIQLEDLDDGVNMKNQWLIRTPRKSFHVAAASAEEKHAWLEHIEECRSKRLQLAGRVPGCTFATAWIPNQASAVCMRCSVTFTVNRRRHHCRRCGFVVCQTCSKDRALMEHISSKPVRVCRLCNLSLKNQKQQSPEQADVPVRGDSHGDGTNFYEQDIPVMSEYKKPSGDKWVKDQPTNKRCVPQDMVFSQYVYLKPEHLSPVLSGL